MISVIFNVKLWSKFLKSTKDPSGNINLIFNSFAQASSTSPSPRNAAAFGVVDLPGGGKGLLIHGGWDPVRKTHDDTWLLTEEEEE